YYEDLDNRLGNFEPRTITIEGVTGTVQPGEKKAYDDALKSFQAGNLKKAEGEFSAFANRYPKSPYLPLALFWNGNSKYANKDYTGAIAQLQNLIKRFPNHPRIPVAMLTLGNAQLESGNKAAAKKTFAEIISKYPDTEAAKDAQLQHDSGSCQGLGLRALRTLCKLWATPLLRAGCCKAYCQENGSGST
ncbi:MAG: tol-pal system protein YbgF, partial [Polynucleobacter sp. 24-46-87]